MKGTTIQYAKPEHTNNIQVDEEQGSTFSSSIWQLHDRPKQAQRNLLLPFTNSEEVESPVQTVANQSAILSSSHTSVPSQSLDDHDAVDWFMKCITTHCFHFSGRARRREFWSFLLIGAIVSFLTISTDSIFGIGIFSYVVNLWLMIQLFAVGTRRLHDIGLSGWWQLLCFTGIGIIVLILMWLINSEREPNKYGQSPKINTLEIAYSS